MDYSVISSKIHSDPVPTDWSVVIADVRGSTQLMEKGRQCDVNLVGTACIAAIRNHFKTREVPYVFGGDGATFLVSNENLPKCLNILNRVRSTSRRNLGIELRLGSITVKTLKEKGASLSVGFVKGAQREELPYFRGTAIALADRLIKQEWSSQESAEGTDLSETIELGGLGCTHQPFGSLRGRILSVIVEFQERKDAGHEDAILQRIFGLLTKDGPLDRFRPIQKSNLTKAWLGEEWKTQADMSGSGMSWLHRNAIRLKTAFRHIFGKLIFHLDVLGIATGRDSKYTENLISQTDWIKMDGALRLVLDVTEEDEKAIGELLETLYRENLILYGMFTSTSALMTCHLKTMSGHQHSHFIDGSDGGLTLAAMNLKQQKSSQDRAS